MFQSFIYSSVARPLWTLCSGQYKLVCNPVVLWLSAWVKNYNSEIKIALSARWPGTHESTTPRDMFQHVIKTSLGGQNLDEVTKFWRTSNIHPGTSVTDLPTILGHIDWSASARQIVAQLVPYNMVPNSFQETRMT